MSPARRGGSLAGFVRRAARGAGVHGALTALRQDPRLFVRSPRLAVAIVRRTRRNPKDPKLLPLLERALELHRTRALLRQHAIVLMATGATSAARDVWRELAGRGDRAAARYERVLAGRLIETDPTWLPVVDVPRETIEPASRRRILHIAKHTAPERWSGFTIRTLHNLRAQQAAGLEPVIVTETGWPRAAGVVDVAPMVVFEGVEHHRLDRGAGYDPSTLPPDVRVQDVANDLVPIVRDLRPAILHAHSGWRGGDHALMALALRDRFGIPVVYEVRGLFEASWTHDMRIAEGAELYGRRLDQETRIINEVDGVIAISQSLVDELASRGVPRDRITVVPNGIDPDALRRPARDESLRRELALDGQFVIGYLGNLDSWREGIETMIDALELLRERRRHDVAMLVVGDGIRRASLQRHAARRGVADWCRFTGRVAHADVAQYYAQMDLFVNARMDERASRLITPIKPFEAMALGVPVLVSDLPALREIVEPDRGFLVPPEDAKALADMVEQLADDAKGRTRVASAAEAWVRSERTWLANGPRYVTAYEKILGTIV